jgi:hypothetical protein
MAVTVTPDPPPLRRRRDDPHLYHLVIDTSAFGIDTCVNVIVAASDLRIPQARSRG